MKTVILIAGPKRSGKDFMASILQQKIKSNIYSFADPIKAIMNDAFNITPEQSNDFKNSGVFLKLPDGSVIDFREILVNFGNTGMKKVFGKDVWTDLCCSFIDDNPNITIVPDFRLLREYLILSEKYNVITIKVENNIAEAKKGSHITENELNDFEFDYIIDNNKKYKEDLVNSIDLLPFVH